MSVIEDAEGHASTSVLNPLEPAESLKQVHDEVTGADAPQQPLPEDSAVTKAEKVERNGAPSDEVDQRPAKRVKLDEPRSDRLESRPDGSIKGVASVKAEYRVDPSLKRDSQKAQAELDVRHHDDDDAEGKGKQETKAHGKKKKAQGQNTKRDFGFSRDTLQLCATRARANEFDPQTCRFGASCKFEHDIRKYLAEGKREDLQTFNGLCPLFKSRGTCVNGWKCRFAGSHSKTRELEDGRKELVLSSKSDHPTDDAPEDDGVGQSEVVNNLPADKRLELSRKRYQTVRSEPYTEFLNKMGRESEKGSKPSQKPATHTGDLSNNDEDSTAQLNEQQAQRASYVEPPFLPSEKRRLYYGPETPVLAPLTTQGNMPFRRLCVDLGAQITWSEMAMGLPLVQGEKSEWALMKAHVSELQPPRYKPRMPVYDYDNGKDFRFGAQIAGNKPWLALKTTEIITSICPSLRAVDLNCGCPIDLVYRQGAGSALLDTPGKLEKILRGMNVVSGEVPVTVKIRMGTRDNKPTAESLVSRLAFGGTDANDYGLGPCGVAAITLHGRSRQQRYTRSADWSYISQCAAVVKQYNEERDALVDTARETDARDQANSKDASRMYFIGNGDCYSHEDYQRHIADSGVDSVMVARGALIKPWIFEEIEQGQHLDKSASERLEYVERFVRYGLEAWGSDEIGIGTTRRFLLEWLSFACRYVPVGILEHLPPNIQDRPPAFKGRNELETLLCSDNYKDWMKISDMFLGKANDNFRFTPKHKSNSYEVEAEG